MKDGTAAFDDGLPAPLAGAAAEHILAAAPRNRLAAVAALIAAHPEHRAALQRLADDLERADRLLETSFPGPSESPDLGPYRVLRTLGEGAFGTVYLCAQEQPVERQVAVKVLRPGAGDRHTLLRFEQERQLLARLGHPAVAQVFDAGVMSDGRPFFVMEFVDGVPISRYCEEHALPFDDRVTLFLELCRGIEHAHRRGIVHRDLKPANVLVLESDGRPLPKVIDFGIAKALHVTATGSGPLTDTGRVVGTPGYMSPEQAAGHASAVDARSDVFALGVMLYELLTGTLPWPRGAGATDTEPVRPSSRVRTRSPSTPTRGAPCSRQVVAALRGELDWITLKALAREPAHRYASVAALIDDVERHRAGQPVSARPPSFRYRLRRLHKRHRAAVRAAAVATSIVIIVLGLAWGHGRSADAAASAAFDDATAAVRSLLERADDERVRTAPNGDALRQELADDALGFYDRFLASHPTDPALREGRCRALLTLSQVHWALGQLQRARTTAEEARAEAVALLALEPNSVARRGLLADAHRKLGRASFSAGDTKAGNDEFVAAVEALEQCHRAAPDDYAVALAAALRELATAYEQDQRLPEAAAAMQRSVDVLAEIVRRQPESTEAQRDLNFAQWGLAGELLKLRELDQADRWLTEAAAALPRLGSDAARAESNICGLQGRLAMQRGDRGAAQQAFRSAITAGERWVQQQPKRLLPMYSLQVWWRELGYAQEAAEAWDDASASFRQALAIGDDMIAEFPEDPKRVPAQVLQLVEFARVLWDRFRRQDLPEAEACARAALTLVDGLANPIDPQRLNARWAVLTMLAKVLDAEGKDSASVWEEAAAILPDHCVHPSWLIQAWTYVARRRIAAGQWTGGERALVRGHALFDPDDAELPDAEVALLFEEARLAALRGDHAAAAASADQMLARSSGWRAKHFAADALRSAWRCAASADAVDVAVARGYRDRAAALYQDVIAATADDAERATDDAWYVVPWGFSNLHLAEIEFDRGDHAAAAERVAAVLPRLLAVQASSPLDVWEPATIEAAQRLQR